MSVNIDDIILKNIFNKYKYVEFKDNVFIFKKTYKGFNYLAKKELI